MTECANSMVREALPEYVSGALSVAEQARVSAHVATCAVCASEQAVLARVFDARPVPPAIDIASIVAALPNVGVSASASAASRPDAARQTPLRLQVITGGAAGKVPSMQGSRRSFRAAWRMAAVLAVVAVGTLSVSVAKRGMIAITEGDATGQVSLLDSAIAGPVNRSPARPTGSASPDAPLLAQGTSTVESVGVAITAGTAVKAAAVAPALLPVNELSDFTDAELSQLLASLEAWDGASAVEPVRAVTVPTDRLLPEEL